MNTSDPRTSDIARLRDASEWIQLLNESNSQSVVDQWMHWCKSDPLNLPTFEHLQSTWDALYRANRTTSRTPMTSDTRKHRRGLIALAASIVLLVGVAGWFSIKFSDVQAFDTAIGEQHHFDLADGSSVDLAPDSHVSTRFTLAKREVQLERGQAFFAVAHSAVRPFVVRANDLKVTAAGTAFDVRIDPGSTVVTVGEGHVNMTSWSEQVHADPGGGDERVRASVGQQVTYSHAARRFNVATVDPTVAGSWRHGGLQFEGEPLENVVGVINRYGEPHIFVSPAFRQTRFTGTVSPKHVSDWLKALEQIYAVNMVDQGTNGILIRSRDDNGIPK